MKFAMAVLIFAIRGVQAGQSVNEQANWIVKGQELNTAGQYSAAVAAFRKALATHEANGIEDEETIGIYQGLAMAYTEMGRLADARREYQRALALAEKIDNGDTLLRGLLIAKIAAISANEANDKTATELRHAIAATRETASADQLAVMRVSLAQILAGRKKYGEAETVLREAVADLRNEKNPAPRRLLDSLNALGVSLFNQRRYSESNSVFREALQVSEDTLGSEHPMLIPTLCNLATSYLKMSRPQDAVAVLQHTLTVASKTIGEDHPTYGILLGNYAIALRELGQKQEAKKIAARSKKIESAFRRRNGLDSTISFTSLNGH